MKKLIALAIVLLIVAAPAFAAATTFREKLNVAYVNIANAVASEAPSATDHAKRLAIAKQFAAGGGSMDWFITVDMTLGQGYSDSTAEATIESRLSALLSNLVALGYGG